MTTRHPAMLLGLPATSAPPVPRIARASILAWTRAALVRMWERRRLAELDDRALCDIGITRGEAHAEANKPFWRL
jgi:uncharacterized protein YjiS (DUF1127 family)